MKTYHALVDLDTRAVQLPPVTVAFNEWLELSVKFTRNGSCVALPEETPVTLTVKKALDHTGPALGLDVTADVTGDDANRVYALKAQVTGDDLSAALKGKDSDLFSLQITSGTIGDEDYEGFKPARITILNNYSRPDDALPSPTLPTAWSLIKSFLVAGANTFLTTNDAAHTITINGVSWRTGSGLPDNAVGSDQDFYLRTSNGFLYQRTSGTYAYVATLKGTDGTNGATWRSGSGAPSNGTGADGDFYFDTATGDVYKRTSGTYSTIANINGAPGNNGTNGATWRSGSGVPSNGTGADGDFYFDTATGDVYKRTSGTYSTIANIKGAPGNNGTNGATWRSGSGAPSNGTGADGDFYFNTATGDVYKRTSGTYSTIANIKGADGMDGTTMRTGAGAPDNAVGADNDIYYDTASGALYKRTSGSYSVIANLNIVGPEGTANIKFGTDERPADHTWPAGSVYIDFATNEVWQVDDMGVYQLIGTLATGEGSALPAGGTTGQVLTKIDDTDGNVEWATPAEGDLVAANNLADVQDMPTALNNLIGSVGSPARGTIWFWGSDFSTLPPGEVGQVLMTGGPDADPAWNDPASGSLPNGGTTNQVLAKVDDTDGNANWVNVSSLVSIPSVPTTDDIADIAEKSMGFGSCWTSVAGTPSNGEVQVANLTAGAPPGTLTFSYTDAAGNSWQSLWTQIIPQVGSYVGIRYYPKSGSYSNYALCRVNSAAWDSTNLVLGLDGSLISNFDISPASGTELAISFHASLASLLPETGWNANASEGDKTVIVADYTPPSYAQASDGSVTGFISDADFTAHVNQVANLTAKLQAIEAVLASGKLPNA